MEIQSTRFITGLFQYNRDCNRSLIETMQEHPRLLSENAIRFLSHILNSHHIWNCKIQNLAPVFSPWTVHHLPEMEELDSDNLKTSLQIINGRDLDKRIIYTTAKGGPFAHTILDILFQVINHSTYHRGQIALEFRATGIEPLLTDYIFFKMKNEPNHN